MIQRFLHHTRSIMATTIDGIGFEKYDHSKSNLPIKWHFDEVYGPNGLGSYTNWHREIEILYFTEGTADVLCDQMYIPAQKGTVVILYPYHLHRVRNTSRSCRFHCILVDPWFLSHIQLWDDSFIAASSNQEKCRAGVERIICELNHQEPHSKTILRGEIIALVGRMNSSVQNDFATKGSNLTNAQMLSMRQAIRYIYENYSTRITIPQICKIANMSKSNFSQYFHQLTGYSFVNYLNLVRCKKAYDILLNTDVSINECAMMCGFQTPSYFSMKFRQTYNILPSDVRQQNRSQQNG